MRKESEQDKILAMHEDGFTPKEMQETLGCSMNSIYATHYKLGLKANAKKILCPHCDKIFSIK